MSKFSYKQLIRMEYCLNHRFVPEKDYKNFYGTRIHEHKKYATYRGVRLLHGLPSHGQRTHTNAKTSKRLRFKPLRKVSRR